MAWDVNRARWLLDLTPAPIPFFRLTGPAEVWKSHNDVLLAPERVLLSRAVQRVLRGELFWREETGDLM
jgi:hypothetical protein